MRFDDERSSSSRRRSAVTLAAVPLARSARRCPSTRAPRRSASSERRLGPRLDGRLVELPYLFADQLGPARARAAGRPLELATASSRMAHDPSGRGEPAMASGRRRRRAARGQAGLHLRRLRAASARRRPRRRSRSGWPRAGREGRGRDDRSRRSGSRTRSASRSSTTSRAASSPSGSRSGGLEIEGELWAMMLDPKRTFDELIDRIAPDPERADEIKANRVYRELSTRRVGLAGVHRDREAVRPRPRGRLRPARARHAAVAQRARLPRRARPADARSSRAGR